MNAAIEFTVIGTSYNDSKIIINYFESMSKQSIQPKEYILVDGGSSDNTVDIAHTFAKKVSMPVRVISGKRLNIAEGYNEGIRASETNLIIITGLGNKYDENFFEELVNYYTQNDCEIVYGPIVGQDNNLFSSIYNKAYLRGKKGWRSWIPSNRGVLIDRTVFDKVGYFYEKFVYAGEDSEFFRRAKNFGIKIGYTTSARLYWETPKSMREHIKKKNAYYIGGMQHSGHKKDLLISFLGLLFILLAVVFRRTVYPYICIALLYLGLAYRIKSLNPLAIGLRVFDMFLPLYLSIKNRKYNSMEYKVKED